MQKDPKVGHKGVQWKAGHRSPELNYSRTPVIVSSASFKRYELEEKAISSDSISLASIAKLGRFLPSALGFKFRRG